MRGRRRLVAVASDFGIYLDVGYFRVSLIFKTDTTRDGSNVDLDL